MNKKRVGPPRFSSRWAPNHTCIGMAVGTGNIRRFPREVARNGGGSFLIPWLIFLFLWSIPLLMAELSIGRKTRRGPYSAFSSVLGKNWSPLGGFVSICAIMILCYYAVVTGWTFKYFSYAVQGSLNQISSDQAVALFDQFRSTYQSLFFHLLAVGVAAYFVFRGARGIERLNKVLIPCLVLILVYSATRALMLDGAKTGVAYLFTVEPHRLLDPAHWIAGLTQSAWSTGAGWGLMLSYAVYARKKDNPMTTPVATGLGNNSIELLVGLMIFPAVFALVNEHAVDFIAGVDMKGGTGIAFQSVPLLFQEMAGGHFLNILFFLGLMFAALTSLVSLIELATRFFQDFGLTRNRSLGFTITVCLLLGTPSALSDEYFNNQDFVWGVGLIVSGLCLAIFVLRYGALKFFVEFIGGKSRGFGRLFQCAMILVVLEAILLLVWFLYQDSGRLALHCLGQWALVVVLLFVFRNALDSRMLSSTTPASMPAAEDG